MSRTARHIRTGRSAWVGAAAALLLSACAGSDAPTRPAPVIPGNPQGPSNVRAAAFIVDVNLRTQKVSITPAAQGVAGRNLVPSFSRQAEVGSATPGFSILAGDVVQLTASNYQASTVGQFQPGRVRVRFDINITNRLSGVQLITPTFPTPPAGTNGILLFPFEAVTTVTSGGVSVGGDGTEVIVEQPSSGAVEPSVDWDAAPYNFFNDAACTAGSNDCYRFETFNQPLASGGTSEARTVGFDIDPTVGSFRARLIVAADLQNSGPTPTGTVAGSVTSPQIGAIAGATVTVQTGGFTGTTDAGGAYSIASVTTGPKTVAVSNLPAGCTVPASQNVTVTSGGTATVNFSVTCTVPSGSVTGTITRDFDGAPLSGVTVTATPAGGSATGPAASNASGVYALANVPVAGGSGTLTLGNLPAGCTNASPYPYSGLTAGGTATVNITVACTPPPSGYPFGYTWGAIAGNQVTLTVAVDMSTFNDPNVNGAGADDIQVIQGRVNYDATRLQFVSAANVSGSPFSAATANGATAGVINWGNFHTLATPVTGNVQLIRFTFNVLAGAPTSVTTSTGPFVVAGSAQIDPVTGENVDLRPRLIVTEATLSIP